MSRISIQNNPYEAVYRGAGLPYDSVNKTQAEELIRHLGLIYNTFGVVIKDFIRAVGPKFEQNPQSQPESTTVPKSAFEPAPRRVMQIQTDKSSRAHVQDDKPTKKNIAEDLNEGVNIKRQPQRSGECQLNSQFELQIENYAYNNEKHSVHSVKSSKSKADIKSKSDQSSHFFSQFIKSDKKYLQAQLLDLKSRNIQNSQTIIVQEDQLQVDNTEQVPNRQQQRCRQRSYFHDEFSEFCNEKEVKKETVRVLPGRTKKERQNFKGIVCADCERYYKMMGLEGAAICECSSRHRSNIPMRRFEKNNFTQQFDID